MEGQSTSQPASNTFTADDPSVQPFTISPPSFLAHHFPVPTADSDGASLPAVPAFLATSALVFDFAPTGPPRVLLVQRAAHDSKPLRWETPGGGCDDDDASMLHSCARELREETGLVVRAIGPLVPVPGGTDATMGGEVFQSRKGKVVCRFYFVVEVDDGGPREVILDPNEHAAFVWATERELKAGRIDSGTILDLTADTLRDVVVEAFKRLRGGCV